MPKAQRSRACQQCRERRVKCDETPETCQQCHRLGLRCSGPLQGSVIIDMTDRVTKPRPRKKREAKTSPPPASSAGGGSGGSGGLGGLGGEGVSPKGEVVVVKAEPDTAAPALALPVLLPPTRKPSVGQQPDHPDHPDHPDRPRGELDASEAITRIQHHYRHPSLSLYQPSRAVPDALDTAFISHFVQQNNATRRFTPQVPFITHLPNLSGNTSKPAVRLSIRAASMAFFAVVHRDSTILVDSYRWYTMSLNCQRQSLQRIGANNSIPDAEEILVPIILSIYEAYAGTTTTSIWPHMAAAAKIIEMRGPTNCTGITSTLFKIMRVSDSHKAIIFNSPSVFASHEWMTVPWTTQTKSAHQEIADILLQIPSTIAMLDIEPGSLRRFFTQHLPFTARVEPVAARIHDWLRDLDRWAQSYPYLTKAPEGDITVTADMTNLSAGVDVNTNGEIVLPNSFVAFTAASYQALRVILLLLLHKIMPKMAQSPISATSSMYPSPSSVSSPRFMSTDESSIIEAATTAAQKVLTIAKYQETTHQIGGFDVLRTVFPLVIVGSLGPRQKEKDQAVDMLTRWGRQRGISGLCAAWLQV